ncbi:Butyrate kinase 2 [Sporomusa silvacetica DSM 10669]|uniref:Probable butyrate kinase n=1 Tax=Sporomusa silvacetica DSM 10669 TaxID=1123289 RepID=A0ABZ3ILH6_9FIRM|nr:butyrate kinase [Sporomusa silvacetica]OZC13451.1 butyrate kinase 2 [Sporomusa silvacetica DSM 10669]
MNNRIFRVLAINAGATSTKNGIFENEKCIFQSTIRHDYKELAACGSIKNQKKLRTELVLNFVKESGVELSSLDAVVGRGGIIKPLESGTYSINDKMIEDLSNEPATIHASSLAGIIAREIGDSLGIPSFIVDPVTVDELCPQARLTGIKGVERQTIFHALNSKAVARRVCKKIGKKYEESRLVVAHMGGGITVGAHLDGRVVDVNSATAGEGPFSPERSGGVPLFSIIEMCYSGSYSKVEIMDLIVKKSGMQMHIETSDLRKAEEMITGGDSYAALVVETMAYMVAKEIGAMFAVLSGRADGIILTGGLAYSTLFTNYIKERVEQLATVYMCPGEDELLALAEGALAVLRKERAVKQY